MKVFLQTYIYDKYLYLFFFVVVVVVVVVVAAFFPQNLTFFLIPVRSTTGHAMKGSCKVWMFR